MRLILILVLLLFISAIAQDNQMFEEGEHIYTKGKIFTFTSTFLDDLNEIVAEEKVMLHIIGGVKDKYTHQFKARWEYEAYPELNKEITIGIREDEKSIFLHQPRYGKYLFTEIAGFPSVQLPLYVGLKSKGVTKIPKNSDAYGPYQGWKVRSKTEVIGKAQVELPFCGKIETWKINVCSKHRKGRSSVTFFFNKDYGFVKMIFKDHSKSSLVMELIQIKEL